MNRINGKAFDVRFMYTKIHFEGFTLTVEDNSGVAMTKGAPDGNLPGDKKANGELKIDSANLMLLAAVAKVAGSWDQIPTFPIDTFAEGENESVGYEAVHIRAHGCKMRFGELLNIDPNSNEKTVHTIKFDVTGRDFVWVDGTPISDVSGFSLF